MKRNGLLSLVIILAAGLFGNFLRFSEHAPEGRVDFGAIPAQLAEYSGKDLYFSPTTYEVLKADTSLLRQYRAEKEPNISLFVAYFKSQKYGSQIHSPKHCLPGGGWRIEAIAPYPLSFSEGVTHNVNRLVIADRDFKAVMFYWYRTRSGTIRSEYGLKLDLVKNSLLFRPTDAAIVRITVDAPDGDIRKATRTGVEFMRSLLPHISRSLPF